MNLLNKILFSHYEKQWQTSNNTSSWGNHNFGRGNLRMIEVVSKFVNLKRAKSK